MNTYEIASLLNDPQKMQWLVLLIIWTIPWKGVALWRSAKHQQLYWFIGVLVLNTFGVLEIIYLAFFQKKDEQK